MPLIRDTGTRVCQAAAKIYRSSGPWQPLIPIILTFGQSLVLFIKVTRNVRLIFETHVCWKQDNIRVWAGREQLPVMLICEPKPIFCSRLMPGAHHGCFWNSWIAFICRKLLHAHFKTCLLGYKRLPSLNRLRYALCGMCWKFSNKPALGLQIILLIVPAFNNMSHWAKTLPLCPRLPPVQVQPPMFPAYLFTYRCKLRRKITCGKY